MGPGTLQPPLGESVIAMFENGQSLLASIVESKLSLGPLLSILGRAS